MTANAFLTAVRTALTEDLGPDWEVCAADDEWAALTVLASSAPGRYRLVVQAGGLEPIEGEPCGLLCRHVTQMIVQTRRGMSADATAEAEALLLDAEEAVRRHVLALLFQVPGNPAYNSAALAAGQTPHPTAGQFAFAGSDSYTPSMEDVVLEHPARLIRFTNLLALSTPDNLRPVPLAA